MSKDSGLNGPSEKEMGTTPNPDPQYSHEPSPVLIGRLPIGAPIFLVLSLAGFVFDWPDLRSDLGIVLLCGIAIAVLAIIWLALVRSGKDSDDD